MYQAYIVSDLYCIRLILYQTYIVSGLYCIRLILYQAYSVSEQPYTNVSIRYDHGGCAASPLLCYRNYDKNLTLNRLIQLSVLVIVFLYQHEHAVEQS